MKIRIVKNKFSIIYNMILDILLLIVLVSGYVEHISFWRLLIVILFLLTCVIYSKRLVRLFQKKISLLLSLILLFIMLLLCSIASSSSEYTWNNIKGIIYPLLAALVYVITIGFDIGKFKEYLHNRGLLINIAYIINTLVLFRQISGNGFMIKKTWLLQNRYYADQCSGLFGYNSTHVYGLFSVFVLLLNLQLMKDLRNRNHRILFGIYIGLTELIVLYCAAFSDNMALYFITPAFLMLYFLNQNQFDVLKNLATKFFKILSFLIGALLIAYIFYRLPGIRTFTDKLIVRFTKFLFYRKVTVKGSNERFAIPMEALSHSWGWKFGIGIGTASWRSLGAFGYSHFGLSSIGSFVYLCGIWFYLVTLYFYSNIASNFVMYKKRFYGWKARATIVITLIFLTVYTYLFTEFRLILLYLLILSVIQLQSNNEITHF